MTSSSTPSYKTSAEYIARLNEFASSPIDDVSNSIKLSKYYQMLDNIFMQGHSYLKQNDQRYGYIFLQRYSISFLQQVTKHKDFKKGTPQEVKARRKVLHCIEYCERLKPILKENWDKKVVELKKQHAEAAAAAAAAVASPSSDESKDGAPELDRSSSSNWSILYANGQRPPAATAAGGASPAVSPASPDADPMFDVRPVSVPQSLVAEFLSYAKPNTDRDIETCGILTGKSVGERLEVTTVIIPKQHGTPNSCVTSDEEELIEVQMRDDLVTLGWIHTHPSQTCFLSSVDLHTQFSYQIMCPEAIAIVCAPTANPNLGVFSLCDPKGMDVVKKCPLRGFHEHRESGIYSQAPHSKWTEGKCKFIDLR